MVVHSCNPSTQEGKAGGSRVPGQLGLHGKTVFCLKKKIEDICIHGENLRECGTPPARVLVFYSMAVGGSVMFY
jgi:hypothetical protein